MKISDVKLTKKMLLEEKKSYENLNVKLVNLRSEVMDDNLPIPMDDNTKVEVLKAIKLLADLTSHCCMELECNIDDL